MNKLEEYRENQSLNEDYNSGRDVVFKRGFDAAIALDLPVKFAEWHQELECCTEHPENMPELWDENPTLEGFTSHSLKPMEELYQYWINNIYKPE